MPDSEGLVEGQGLRVGGVEPCRQEKGLGRGLARLTPFSEKMNFSFEMASFAA